MQHQIFLSYSRKDSPVMEHLCADLRAADLTVWTDEGIEAGTPSWKRTIQDAIDGAGCLVVMLSPDAKQSEWVERELDYASAQKVPIFSVLVRGDEASAIPFMLIGSQFIDIRADYAAGLQKLVYTLHEHFQPGSSPKAPLPAASSHTAYTLPDQDTLDPWNIFDQVRLLSWLIFKPANVQIARARQGDEVIRQTAAWIVGLVAWLPFLMTAAGYIFGTMDAATNGNRVYVVFAGLLYLVGWLVTARFGAGRASTNAISLLVMSTVMTIIGFWLVTVQAGFRPVASENAASTSFVLLATCISIGGAAGLAFRLANAATATLAGTVLGTLINAALGGLVFGTVASLAGLLMVAIAFGVSFALENNLHSGRASRLGMLLFSIVVLDYAVMIWVYFLGGWSVLVRG